MPQPEIPLLCVAGSHAEIGRAIGERCAETIREDTAFDVYGRGDPCDPFEQRSRFATVAAS